MFFRCCLLLLSSFYRKNVHICIYRETIFFYMYHTYNHSVLMRLPCFSSSVVGVCSGVVCLLFSRPKIKTNRSYLCVYMVLYGGIMYVWCSFLLYGADLNKTEILKMIYTIQVAAIHNRLRPKNEKEDSKNRLNTKRNLVLWKNLSFSLEWYFLVLNTKKRHIV